jgi:hypothetical protein
MSMSDFSKNFDGSMYKAGRQWTNDEGCKCSPAQFVGMEAAKADVWPDDKSLDRLTARLIDRYKVPEWAEAKRAQARELAAHQWVMDAYWKEYKVVSEGPLADCVQKAFEVTPAQFTVFPFFWDTIIVEQLMAMPLLDVLIGDTISINSGTAVHLTLNETIADRSIGLRGELTTMQEVNVSQTESTVKLLMLGAQVTISDEVMRRQRIPVFQRWYGRYGRQIGIDVTDLCLDTAINGDAALGGSGAAATVVTGPSVAGSPTYADYARLMMSSDIGYEFTDMVMSRAGWTKLLNVPVFEDPLSGFKFQAVGVLPEPFGLTPHRWDSPKSTSWTSAGVVGDGTTVLTLQRGRALTLYEEGGLTTESERSVTTKGTTVVSGWNLAPAIMDANARRVMLNIA